MATRKPSVTFSRRDDELTDKQHEHLCEILEYMLTTCNLTGNYVVNAIGAAKQGKGSAHGVHIGIANEHGIAFTYQPSSSKKKAMFTIALAGDEATRIQKVLKAKFSKPVYSLPKPKAVTQPEQVPAPKAAAVVQAAESPFFIENFSAKNQEHALAFAQAAQERAQAFADAVLPKAEVSKLLATFTGKEPFGVGSFMNGLISRGYLVKFGDVGFQVKTEDLKPEKSYSKKRTKKDTAAPKAEKPKKADLSLSDSLLEVYRDQSRMLPFYMKFTQQFGKQEGAHTGELFALMREVLLPGESDQMLRLFLDHLIKTKKLEKVGRGWFRLSEKEIHEVYKKGMKPSLETKKIILSEPMRQVYEDAALMNQFYTACVKRFEGQDTVIPSEELFKMVESLLFPGMSDWSHRHFVKYLVASGYLARLGRSTFQLTQKAVESASVQKSVTSRVKPVASFGPEAVSGDLSVSNEALAAAVRTKLRLKAELTVANERAEAAEAKRDALEARVAALEAQLQAQPDIAQLVQEGVAAELQRLLSED